MGCLSDIHVVILAGGLGTRLEAVQPDLPKALTVVGGRPIVDRLIEQVASCGAQRVVLALGHLAEQVVTHLKGLVFEGVELACVVESRPLGTGGALRLAAESARLAGCARERSMLVMNGDSYVTADLCKLVDFHVSHTGRASLLLVKVDDPSQFGAVLTDKSGAVTSFVEKGGTDGVPAYINAGVYVMDDDVMERIPAGEPTSLENDVFPALVGRGLYALESEASFIDIGTPRAFAEADRFFVASAE